LRVVARLPWIILFIVSGACLLQLQTRYFFDWKKLNIQGPGGSLGYFFGKKLLLTAMGDVGSMILLAGIYVSALILMTGLRPIHLVRESVAGVRNSVVRFREWRLRREMRRADIKGQLAISERELAKQRRLIEKQLKKKGAPVPERTVMPPEELAGRPKPKVVDTTALPDDVLLPPRKKPSLAELQPSKTKAPVKMAEARKFDAEHYVLPSIDLLDEHDPEGRGGTDLSELEQVQEVLIETLGQFGIAVAAGDITKGPTITRYEVYPAKGVRVDKIVSLERDLARATRAERINILAPIPGKDTVGIEIANTRKIKVTLRELMQSSMP
jgi:DNA segregation ATPase FtsK/SpoIIIE, S-DNA-T family